MDTTDVKSIRKNLNKTQDEFAKMLGVTAKTIRNWEAGYTIPATKKEILQQYKIGNITGNIFESNNEAEKKTDNALIEMLKNQLAEKDRQLKERDNQIAEKDKQLAEKDKQIAEKDKQMSVLLQMVREKDVRVI